MTPDELARTGEAHDRQIGKIIGILEGLATTIQAHDRQLADLTVKMAETTGKLRRRWLDSQPTPAPGALKAATPRQLTRSPQPAC